MVQAVGLALSFWEHLESVQAYLFHAIVRGKNHSSYMAYCSVDGSAARLNMLKSAVECGLNEYPETQTRINGHARLIGNFSSRRNEIAHGLIVKLGDADYQLGPNPIKLNKWSGSSAKFQYSAQAVLHYAWQFVKIHDSTFELIVELHKYFGFEVHIPQRLLHIPGNVSIQ
ncbi:hypothetical protein [Methylobacterium sp. CM6246]